MKKLKIFVFTKMSWENSFENLMPGDLKGNGVVGCAVAGPDWKSGPWSMAGEIASMEELKLVASLG